MGHSIRILLQKYFKATEKELNEKIMTYTRELDRHHIPSRHPKALPMGTPHEAYDSETSMRTLKAAAEIMKFVRGEIHGRVGRGKKSILAKCKVYGVILTGSRVKGT